MARPLGIPGLEATLAPLLRALPLAAAASETPASALRAYHSPTNPRQHLVEELSAGAADSGVRSAPRGSGHRPLRLAHRPLCQEATPCSARVRPQRSEALRRLRPGRFPPRLDRSAKGLLRKPHLLIRSAPVHSALAILGARRPMRPLRLEVR